MEMHFGVSDDEAIKRSSSSSSVTFLCRNHRKHQNWKVNGFKPKHVFEVVVCM
jgi:hypothetical protein